MMGAMETIASYQDLVALLSQAGLQHQADAAGRTVQVMVEKDDLIGSVFIQWQEEQKLLHLVLPLSIEISPAHLPQLALALAILNHGLPLPGFGLNVAINQCYFRITVPLRPSSAGGGFSIAGKEVQGLFNLVVTTAAQHLPRLREIAAGSFDPMTLVAPS